MPIIHLRIILDTMVTMYLQKQYLLLMAKVDIRIVGISRDITLVEEQGNESL
jgi:hypothetical protein